MTISGIAGNFSLQQSSSAASTSSSGSSAGSSASSIGEQLLAALEQSEAANGTASDPLLSYVVSLNSQSDATGTTAASSTYDAQGLLSQMQTDMLVNDPLLTSDNSGTANATDALLSTQNGASILDQMTNLDQSTSSAAAGTSAPSASDASTTTPGSSALANLIQSDPALAVTLENSRIDQQFISMLP